MVDASKGGKGERISPKSNVQSPTSVGRCCRGRQRRPHPYQPLRPLRPWRAAWLFGMKRQILRGSGAVACVATSRNTGKAATSRQHSKLPTLAPWPEAAARQLMESRPARTCGEDAAVTRRRDACATANRIKSRSKTGDARFARAAFAAVRLDGISPHPCAFARPGRLAD